MKLNYFSNYMLKYFPHEIDREMLANQDQVLAKLQRGEIIGISSGKLTMTAGKIIFRAIEN